MKNKPFRKNLGLYIEGLRQSRVIGIPYVCFSILMMIFEVLTNSAIGQVKSPEEGIMLMLIVSFFTTPLILLILFNFLNSRKASDFYHSIPRSRSSLYLSFGAAAVTWAIATIFAMALFEMFGYAVAGHQLDLETWGQVFMMTASANILIAGCVLLAISISSTVFSQVVISGLILFLPRILISCFEDTVTSIVPILPSFEQAVGILGSPRANVLIGLIAYEIEGDAFWHSCIYSLLLGIAYAALGLLFFCRRKSETAASPALNRWVQMGVRVIISFAICLLPTIQLAKELNKGTPSIYFDDITSMLVFYGIALIAYFVYEAISVRSLRGMWKSWPELLIGLAVLLALNLGFIFGAGLSAKAVLAFQPENDEVASISLQTDSRYNSYADLRLAETEISEDAIKSFLASQLRKDVENIDLVNSRYNGYANDDAYALYSNEWLIRFTMTDGREVTRYVFMSDLDSENLREMLLRNKDYVDAAMDLPEDYHEIILYGRSDAADELTDEQLNNLYAIYCEEAAAMKPADYFDDDRCVITDMTVEGRYKGREYGSNCSITLGTPETLEAYIALTQPDKPLQEVLDTAEKASYYSINVNGINFRNGGNYYECYSCGYDYYGSYEFYEDVEITSSSSVYDSNGMMIPEEVYDYDFLAIKENREKLFEELLANENKPIDLSKPFYIVSISVEYETPMTVNDGSYTYEAYTYEEYQYFIQAADEGSCLEMPEFVLDGFYYK